MSSADSFGTRSSLTYGARHAHYFSLTALEKKGFCRRRAAAVLAEDPARESPASRRRPLREGGRYRSAGALGRQERPVRRRFRSRPRACCCRTSRACPAWSISRPCATASCGSAAIRTGQPAAAGRARDRSLGAGRLLRPGQRLSAERRARVLAQQGALRVSSLGTERLPQFPRRAAGHRHRPSGEPRVSRARRRVRTRCPTARVVFPDTLVGTDSHTTMVNGLGVVGWGVGGIEAEAAMLGQPISMLIPPVLGFRLTGGCSKARLRPISC